MHTRQVSEFFVADISLSHNNCQSPMDHSSNPTASSNCASRCYHSVLLAVDNFVATANRFVEAIDKIDHSDYTLNANCKRSLPRLENLRAIAIHPYSGEIS
jgi:hypothetical protein